MADLIIQNPSITPNVFEYDEAGRVSAISGYPLAGGGGGTIVKSDLMWKPSVESDGYVRWTLASSATTPDKAYISGAQGPAGPQGVSGNPGKNPEFQINSENAHWEWRYSGDTGWTDLGVVASGAVGPQGLSGNNGKDGISPTVTTATIDSGNRVTFTYGEGSSTYIDVMSGASGANGINGISPTVSTETITGGNRVTFTYDDGGTTKTESIDVMSGASGANGSDGFSPTVELTPIQDQQYPQGGWNVKITDAEHQAGQTFQVFNGIDGQGATVDLIGGTGIQVSHQAGTTDYTISVSADYAMKSYVDSASANAYDKAVAQIPDVTNFITKDVNNLTYYYKKTETSAANELATEFAKYVSTGDILTGTGDTLAGIKIGSTSYIVPTTDLSNYYTKSETSANFELDAEFANKVDKPDTTQTVLNNNYLIYSTLTDPTATTGWMPLSANYYSKTEADGRYQKKSDMGSYLTTAQYETDSAKYVLTGDILTATNNKLTGIKIGSIDYTVPTTDLSNYYTKSETSATGELNTEFAKKLDSTIAASTYQTKDDMSAYVAVTGDQMTGQLELVGTNYDDYYMKATRTGVTGHARFGMGGAGGAVIKADDGTNNAQMVLKANATSGIEILLQHNSNQTIGNLIPMVVEAAGWTPTGNDYKLHIVLDS